MELLLAELVRVALGRHPRVDHGFRADIYKAPPVNRFRTNYNMLHMLQSTWTLEQKIRSVYAFTGRPGNRRTLSYLSKLSPQMLAD